MIVDRREFLISNGMSALLPAMLGARGAGATQDAAGRSPTKPVIDRPILFNTPEADRILESLEVFPV